MAVGTNIVEYSEVTTAHFKLAAIAALIDVLMASSFIQTNSSAPTGWEVCCVSGHV